jgi:hypothetical protein
MVQGKEAPGKSAEDQDQALGKRVAEGYRGQRSQCSTQGPKHSRMHRSCANAVGTDLSIGPARLRYH